MDQISVEETDLFLISSNGRSANVNIELQTYRDALHKVVIQVCNEKCFMDRSSSRRVSVFIRYFFRVL